jgi:hypothetical protein
MSKKQGLTITYAQIVQATAVLGSMLEKPRKDMSGADKLKLARLYKAMANEQIVFNEQHRELILKHGGVEADGTLTVPPENLSQFSPEYQEMAETTTDLPFGKLPAAILDNSDLSGDNVLVIEFLFE